METAILLFKQYSGQGMIITLFLVALVYLWFAEKSKENRRLFVGLPIGILVMFFCPIVVFLLERLAEEDVYWRMLWSVPMLIVIAYAAILLIRKSEGIKRYISIVIVVFLIVISGDYLYDNPGFIVAENPEHIPENVIEICDEIVVEGREIMACFPSEMLMYVTQYTSFVQMPYGREMFLRPDGAVMWNALYEIMESDDIEEKELARELRAQNCHFVVVREKQVSADDMKDENWIKFYETRGYEVYIDDTNDPRYW